MARKRKTIALDPEVVMLDPKMMAHVEKIVPLGSEVVAPTPRMLAPPPHDVPGARQIYALEPKKRSSRLEEDATWLEIVAIRSDGWAHWPNVAAFLSHDAPLGAEMRTSLRDNHPSPPQMLAPPPRTFDFAPTRHGTGPKYSSDRICDSHEPILYPPAGPRDPRSRPRFRRDRARYVSFGEHRWNGCDTPGSRGGLSIPSTLVRRINRSYVGQSL